MTFSWVDSCMKHTTYHGILSNDNKSSIVQVINMRSRAPFSAQLRVFHQNITCSMHIFPRIESLWMLKISGCKLNEGRVQSCSSAAIRLNTSFIRLYTIEHALHTPLIRFNMPLIRFNTPFIRFNTPLKRFNTPLIRPPNLVT